MCLHLHRQFVIVLLATLLLLPPSIRASDEDDARERRNLRHEGNHHSSNNGGPIGGQFSVDGFKSVDDDRRAKHQKMRAELRRRRHINRQNKHARVIMFGGKQVKLSPGVFDGIMHPTDPLHKMGGMLAGVYKDYMGESSTTPFSPFRNNMDESFVHEDGTVSIDAVAFGDGSDLQDMLDELTPHGFQVDATYRHVASGTIPVSSLGDMCSCSTLMLAMPALSITESQEEGERRREAGTVTSEGVYAMEVDKVLNDLGFIGTGVTVGVLSDSYNTRDGEDDDIFSRNLPPKHRINILDDTAGGIDEGRAMMQIIHDVAPGANLAFHTGFGGQARFAQGIIKLAEAGCDVIVDDIFNTFEPAFQDGIIAQAVDEVYHDYGVAYFSSAGNYGRGSYESAFRDSGIASIVNGITYQLHDFAYGSGPSISFLQTLFLPNRGLVRLIFQWDEPFASALPGSPGSSSDMAFFVMDPVTGVMLTVKDDVNIGQDPIEVADLDVSAFLLSIGRGSAPGYNFQISIGLSKGEAPTRMKMIVISGGRFIDYPTNSATGYGHNAATGSSAVAAAYAQSTPPFGVDPPIVEPYSSACGTPILFDKDGNRLYKPEIRNQPKFTGPDGVINTFFPTPSNPVFTGTSAAAPHVAAVAALMLEANPKLWPNQIQYILKLTATEMSDPTIPGTEEQLFDFRTGYGFVNASAALKHVYSHGKSYSSSGSYSHGGSSTGGSSTHQGKSRRNLRTRYNATLA